MLHFSPAQWFIRNPDCCYTCCCYKKFCEWREREFWSTWEPIYNMGCAREVDACDAGILNKIEQVDQCADGEQKGEWINGSLPSTYIRKTHPYVETRWGRYAHHHLHQLHPDSWLLARWCTVMHSKDFRLMSISKGYISSSICHNMWQVLKRTWPQSIEWVIC